MNVKSGCKRCVWTGITLSVDIMGVFASPREGRCRCVGAWLERLCFLPRQPSLARGLLEQRLRDLLVTSDQLEELANLMVWGVAEPYECDGKVYEPFEPLPSWVAGEFMGLRRRRAKLAMTDPKFRQFFAGNLEAMRNGERARNLAVAVSIRDDIGGNMSTDRAVRLKAIATIEGKDAQGVSISINSGNVTNVVAPGYVIRLAPGAPLAGPPLDALAAPQPEPLTIDATPATEGTPE